jgi:hypothetical protein
LSGVDLPEVTEARVVHVKPGDVIWLRVKSNYLSDRAVEEIRKRAKEVWPDNEIVIGADIDLSVVRAEYPS